MNSIDWRSIIGGVAPALATALGGPLAGMAVQVIGSALGLENASAETVSTALSKAGPEVLAKIKQADQEFAAKMKELDVKLDELVVKDRDSARNLQIQTRAKTPAILSYFVVLSTVSMYGMLLFGDYDKLTISELILGRILGTLDMAFGVVLAYWLGAAHREISNRAPANGKG